MASRMYWSTITLLLILTRASVAQDCIELHSETWSGLAAALSSLEGSAFGFASICPFRIKGGGCDPTEQGFNVQGFGLRISCFGDDSDCVVNCPGRHFNVLSGSMLQLENFSLKGASHSSIYVMEGGSLRVKGVRFQNNDHASGNGGAIYAGKKSHFVAADATFVRNTARNGGAIFSLGKVELKQSIFEDNKAKSGNGGAFFSNGMEFASSVDECEFTGNSANFYGPAIFNGALTSSDISDNNSLLDNRSKSAGLCDGVYDFGLQTCSTMADVPSVSPTPVSSSDSPTIAQAETLSTAVPPTLSPTQKDGASTPLSGPSPETTEPSGIGLVGDIATVGDIGTSAPTFVLATEARSQVSFNGLTSPPTGQLSKKTDADVVLDNIFELFGEESNS